MGALADTAGADAVLAAAARTGDHAAYGELFERYHGRIYNYAYGIVGNPDDAGDVAQDAFVKVFQALPRLTGDVNFSAYVYRTAHNAAMDTVKRRKRFAPPEALDLQWEPSLRADPERVALLQEQQGHAWQAAFELSDDHRAILALRELHDLSYQEIADVMNMPRNTVGVLLSRARLKFKEAFRMSSLDTDGLVKECRDMLPLLSAYIDDELEQAKRKKVETHLVDCAFCRLALEEMTESSRSYRALLPLLVPAAFRDSAWATVSERLTDTAPEAAAGVQDGPLTGTARSDHTEGPPGGAPATAGAPQREPRSWTKILAGLMALAALVLLGVSAAGGVKALRDYRATSTTTETEAVADDPGTSGVQAVAAGSTPTVSTTSTSAAPPSTGPAAIEPVTTEPPMATTTSAPAARAATSGTTVRTTTTTRSAETTSTAAPSTAASTTATNSDPTPSTTTTRTTPLDTQAPPTPALRSPANGAIVSGNAVKLVWQGVKDPSGVQYVVETQRLEGAKYVPGTTYSGLSATAVGHTLTAAFERWRVSAIDGRGNRSAPSSWWTVSKKLTITVPLTILTTTTTGLY